MDILEEQAHLGPSLGQEAHWFNAMAQTLGKYRRVTLPLGAEEETSEDLTYPLQPQRFAFGG
jgi:hypothetical protein